MQRLPSFIVSVRRDLTVAALGLVAALGGAGCGTGEPFIGHVDTVLTEDGSLHLLTRFRSGESEGGDWTAYEFLYAKPQNGTYTVESTPFGEGEQGFDSEGPYFLTFDSEGRPLIVAELKGGLTVQVLGTDAWKTLPRGAGLSEEAVGGLGKTGKLGAAWRTADGRVKVLHGGFLYTIQDEEIASGVEIGAECSMADHCYFDPTGDMSGEAVVREYQVGFELRGLSCEVDGSSCEWQGKGVVGDDDLGGSSSPLHRVFFHTKDGTGVLVRPVETKGAGEDAIVASTLAGETTLFTGDVYQVGGGPLANGGFAAASLGHDEELLLAIVGADGEVQKIDLGRIEFGEDAISVRSRATAGGEEVHVTVRETHTTVAHFVVSLPGGDFTRESISMK